MNEPAKSVDFPNASSKSHHIKVDLSSEKIDAHEAEKANLYFWRIFSAGFYGLSSFLVIVVNKIVLTNYKFPSAHALDLWHCEISIYIKQCAKKDMASSYLFYRKSSMRIRGTKHLSLPMFTVLRRFTILMTLIGEYFISQFTPKLTHYSNCNCYGWRCHNSRCVS
ncbi:hypothetical protein CEXT_29211 [Caerostris extrusa]|uniref:Uncharacterized protein n=1 Tax=Caerostris extrusa TaxID=172846 RepID=A0AAV4PIV9_CAEEX|nr:hypothetical protein CEXT_29211 [Caerostris extrusa]